MSVAVGKPKLASGARESALGYKPKSGRGWSTSGLDPTTDIAAARSAFTAIRSGSRFKAEVPMGSTQGPMQPAGLRCWKASAGLTVIPRFSRTSIQRTGFSGPRPRKASMNAAAAGMSNGAWSNLLAHAVRTIFRPSLDIGVATIPLQWPE